MTNPLGHVVAVDDDDAVRDLIAEYLGKNELRVTCVATGKDLAGVMEREVVDAVILDVRLGAEDGMPIARKLREESAIPILMLTSQIEEADRVMGLELGADDYLTKPFNPRELPARLGSLPRAPAPCAGAGERRRRHPHRARLPLRRLGTEHRPAQAEEPAGRERRADQRRVPHPDRVPCLAAARAIARPAARSLARAQRGGVRPLHRHPDPAPAPQD